MTSKQERVQESFRVTLEERRTIERLWELSGIDKKQDYLRQVALKGLTGEISDTSLAGVVASQQQVIASQQETIRHLSEQLASLSSVSTEKCHPVADAANSASSYQVGVCVRGGGANKLIRAADRAEEDLVLAQGFLWQKSKTPNGNQIILEALCEVPEVVRESALRSLSLTDVQRVVEQYQQYQQFNQETGDL